MTKNQEKRNDLILNILTYVSNKTGVGVEHIFDIVVGRVDKMTQVEVEETLDKQSYLNWL
jgi:hypothetical protein